MMRRVSSGAILVAGAVLGVVACGESVSRLLGPDGDRAAIMDGRDGAEFAHFFFHSPIERSALVPTAAFNPHVRPRVEVCRLTDSEPDSCEEGLVAWFAMDASYDGSSFVELVTEVDGVPAADSMYAVTWKTGREMAGSRFRLNVMLQSRLLGFADILLFENSSELKDLGDNYGDVAGRAIPVKFRVEEGVACDGEECLEASVTTAGGTFATQNAGASFPEGWIGPDVGEVLFILERILLGPGEKCLPTFLPQFLGCYRFRTEPELEVFELPVTVGFCMEPAAWSFRELLSMGKSVDPFDPTAAVTELQGAPADFIQCDPNSLAWSAPGVRGALARAGRRALAPLAQMLGVKPLYAADLGFGSLTGSFSRFGWFLTLAIAAEEPVYQVGLAGEMLPDALTVRVTALHCHESDCGVGGVPVDFDVTAGGGSVSAATVLTDAAGLASTSWTLGPGDGVQTVAATGPGVGPVVFTADAYQILTHFLPPLSAGDGSVAPLVELFWPEVRICPVPVGPGACGDAVEVIPPEAIKTAELDGRKFYQTGWKPRDSGIVEGTFRAQVVLPGGVVAGESVVIVVTRSGKDELDDDVYQTKPNSTTPIKFQLTRP
jgi:hypothetical protein